VLEKALKLTIDGKIYTATLNDNQAVKDILNMLPIKLTLQRYAGHEYYGRLSKKPSIKGVQMTSDAHAGGIYYFDGWGAFTVLYGDAHIAPFEVAHIGDVNEDIISSLISAGDTVEAIIELN
jgi:hypothetical protein